MTSINLKILLFVSISLLINLSNCIKTKNQQKIYGGSSAKYLGWPWQALIQFQDEFKCGGTLINDEWILTAAHCVERTSQANMYKVILGEHNMEIKEGDEIYCDVDKVISHPRYLKGVKDEWDNDIALLKLSFGLNLTKEHAHVKPIKLSWPDSHIINKNCTATGWGRTRFEKASKVLQQVQLQVYDRSKCIQAYNASSITDGMLCAGSLEEGQDTCSGDSGGPLQCEIMEDGELSWVQVGITSWGEGCGKSEYPGVYTKVATYNKWIREVAFSSMRFNRKAQQRECL